jgi:hypothetical protein
MRASVTTSVCDRCGHPAEVHAPPVPLRWPTRCEGGSCPCDMLVLRGPGTSVTFEDLLQRLDLLVRRLERIEQRRHLEVVR